MSDNKTIYAVNMASLVDSIADRIYPKETRISKHLDRFVSMYLMGLLQVELMAKLNPIISNHPSVYEANIRAEQNMLTLEYYAEDVNVYEINQLPEVKREINALLEYIEDKPLNVIYVGGTESICYIVDEGHYGLWEWYQEHMRNGNYKPGRYTAQGKEATNIQEHLKRTRFRGKIND